MSKLENKAYEKLRKNNVFVFKIKDLCLLLSMNKIKAYNLVKSMKRKEIIKKVGKSFFSFKDINEFVIGTSINYPSYISFWSGLNYYGFSDQTPKKIFIATTKYAGKIDNFEYITLSNKRFFGYVKIGDVVIAEKEKAIIDSLLFPKYSGGINEIIKSIETGIKELKISKLVDFSIKVNSKMVIRRLGFILEHIGYKGKYLNILMKKVGKGYGLLDPNLKRRGNLNKKWLLYINI